MNVNKEEFQKLLKNRVLAKDVREWSLIEAWNKAKRDREIDAQIEEVKLSKKKLTEAKRHCCNQESISHCARVHKETKRVLYLMLKLDSRELDLAKLKSKSKHYNLFHNNKRRQAISENNDLQLQNAKKLHDLVCSKLYLSDSQDSESIVSLKNTDPFTLISKYDAIVTYERVESEKMTYALNIINSQKK